MAYRLKNGGSRYLDASILKEVEVWKAKLVHHCTQGDAVRMWQIVANRSFLEC